jgi:hypothetical protein
MVVAFRKRQITRLRIFAALWKRFEVMSDDKELPLIAASLAGGMIAASCPMTPYEAVLIYNQVKAALRRRAQLEAAEQTDVEHQSGHLTAAWDFVPLRIRLLRSACAQLYG